MRRDFLEYGFKLFMSLAAFLFWQNQSELKEDVKEVQRDVKILLKDGATYGTEIINIKQRLEWLEANKPEDGAKQVMFRQLGVLSEVPTLKRRL